MKKNTKNCIIFAATSSCGDLWVVEKNCGHNSTNHKSQTCYMGKLCKSCMIYYGLSIIHTNVRLYQLMHRIH